MFSTSIETAQLLFILLLACVWASEHSTSSGWDKLQISPYPVCSMPYGNLRLNIYEHSVNKMTTIPSQKRFFYDPIVLVDHKSAEMKYNNVTQLGKIRFRIEMWNDKLQNEVIHYLSENIGQEIKLTQVQVIPFEKIILINTNTESSTIYSLSTDWYPYYSEKFLWFSLTCFDQENCHRLKDTMHQDPMEFDNLKLLFSLSSQKSQTKEAIIRFDNIVLSPTIRKLLKQCENTEFALISTEDEKSLLSETTSNVILESFDDSEVISSNSVLQISNALKGLLLSFKIKAKNNDNTSESVCWDDDNQGQVLGKIEEEGEDWSAINEKTKDNPDKSNIDFEDKKMAFSQKSRIDLGKLRDRQKVDDISVKVRFSTAALSTFVRFVPFAELSTTDEWAQLKKELKEFKNEYQNLKMEHQNLKTEYQNLKTEHQNLRMEHQHLKEFSKESKSAATDLISFSATNPEHYEISSRNNVTYTIVKENNGNGLEAKTGIFTVSKTGKYKFTFFAKHAGSDEIPRVFMKKNGMISEASYTSLYSYKDYRLNPYKILFMSTVQYLHTNDKIWMHFSYGYSLSNVEFSGILAGEIK